jgi:hypothetical protein
MLTNDTITFGKYKGKTLSLILRDRKYCEWLLNQDWFKENYEYLYNRVQDYKPRTYFVKLIEEEVNDNFIKNYCYFNLVAKEDLEIELSECDYSSYEFYLSMISDLRERVLERLENDEENPYDIKAPVNWLKRFEKEYGIPREDFKEFLEAYELPNIPYIVEDIKKQGGIDYKGAKSFKIAKARSESQEQWWEITLRERYGERLGTQFKYENCIFDMIVIDEKIIYECKLGLKDLDDSQYLKYKKALKEYSIIYLVGYDAILNMEESTIYCLEPEKYIKYLVSLTKKNKLSQFDEVIRYFNIEKVENIYLKFN